MTITDQIMALVTAATTPILFSALSRLQDDRQKFEHLFLQFQKLVGILIIPMGAGIYVFRDFIVLVILGEQWGEIADFIGLWGLVSSVNIVFAHYCSEVYRSLGKPKLSTLAQFLYIIILWPVVQIAVQHGFDTICYTRALIRLYMVLVQLSIMYIAIKLSPIKLFKNILPSTIGAGVMGLCGYSLLLIHTSIPWNVFAILICIILFHELTHHHFIAIAVNSPGRVSSSHAGCSSKR